ncbi:MAG: hypothetical protein KAK01_06330, partial [Candidatus Marinimicrobia bacterium]|nr:hypothetical protein [Candidatus Neomarinimicrobiota bacterium]
TWTVIAVDSAGNERETSNPQTIDIDTSVPLVLSHTPILEGNHQQNIAVNANYRDDESGFASVKLYYRKGGETVWTEETNNYSGENSITVGYTIFSQFVTSSGVEYHLKARDVAGNIRTLPEAGFYSISISIPGDGLVSTDYWPTGIPNGSAIIDYQLISLPATPASNTPTDVLVDDLGSYNNTKWRFFTYEAGNWLEFGEVMNLVSGRSYFLIVKKAGLDITTGPARTVSTDETFTIPVTAGEWTFIGNPFDFNVPLSNVYLNDNIPVAGDVNFYTWNGDWIEATELEPWHGYIYKSAEGGSLSIIPRKESTGQMARPAEQMPKPRPENGEWLVDIAVSNGFMKDTQNQVGVLQVA